jgi:hypothetical protein
MTLAFGCESYSDENANHSIIGKANKYSPSGGLKYKDLQKLKNSCLLISSNLYTSTVGI